MRGEDCTMATILRDHWQGKQTPPDVTLCPLLADLDRLLAYLDEQGFKPGDAMLPCPECGDHHRWTLLRDLMENALDITPRRHSKLLEMVDARLESVRQLYGGKSGYDEMREYAEKFFARVNADHTYRP